MSSVPLCQHIKVNGESCGCPALRNQSLCYFHHHSAKRQRATARKQRNAFGLSKLFQIPVLEDADAIQIALMDTIHAMLDTRLDLRRASLILYALQTASANLKRCTFAATRQEQPEPWVTELLTALRAIPEPDADQQPPSFRPERAAVARVVEGPASPSSVPCHPERSTPASQTRTCGVEGPFVSSPQAQPSTTNEPTQPSSATSASSASSALLSPSDDPPSSRPE